MESVLDHDEAGLTMGYLVSLFFLMILIVSGWLVFKISLKSQDFEAFGSAHVIAALLVSTFTYISPSILVLHGLLLSVPIICARKASHVSSVTLVAMLLTPSFFRMVNIGAISLFDWSTQGTIALGGLLASLAFRRAKDAATPNWPAIIVIILLVTISARGTSTTSWLRQTLNAAATYALPIIALSYSTRIKQGQSNILLALGFSGIALTVIATFETVRQWPIYAILNSKYGIASGGLIVKYRDGAMRTYASLGEATALGFAIVICLVAIMAARRHYKPIASDIVLPAILLLGVAVSQSRGGMLGAVTAILAYKWYRQGLLGLGKSFMLVTPVAGLLALYLGLGSSRSFVSDAEGTAQYRELLFSRGMEEVRRGSIFGQSYGDAVTKLSDLVQGEGIVDFVNTYLYMAILTGPIGLIAFCIAFWYPVVKLLRVRPTAHFDPLRYEILAFCFGSLVSINVMIAFTSLSPRLMTLCLFVIGMAISASRWSSGRTSRASPVGTLPATRMGRLGAWQER